MGGEKNQDFDEWWAERSLPQKIGLGILFGIGGLGLAFAFGLVVMALWNWLMPEIFGLPSITYWQAWGLLVLSSILFKKMDFGDNGTKTDRKRKRELRRYLREEGELAAQPAVASEGRDAAEGRGAAEATDTADEGTE